MNYVYFFRFLTSKPASVKHVVHFNVTLVTVSLRMRGVTR